MTTNEICPGCGRGCLLSDPQCGVGAGIAREREQGEGATPGAHGVHGEHGERAGRGEHSAYGEHGSRGERGERGARGGRVHEGRGAHEGREGHGPRGLRGELEGEAGRSPRSGRGGQGSRGERGGRGSRGERGGRGPHGHGGPHDGRGPRDKRGPRDPHGGHGGPRGPRGRGPLNVDEATDKLLVHRFHHCAHLLMHRRAKEGGRAGAVMVLSRHGAMSQRALAEKLDIRSASASELLAKMEQQGLIARTPDPADKRAVVVDLTEQGRLEASRLGVQREEANKDLFAVLSDEEKQQLEAILGKLARYWHEEFDCEHGPQGRGGHGVEGKPEAAFEPSASSAEDGASAGSREADS